MDSNISDLNFGVVRAFVSRYHRKSDENDKNLGIGHDCGFVGYGKTRQISLV